MGRQVTTARRSSTCPRCGSREIARILYGLPAFSDKLEADLEAHRIVLGGCFLWDDQPDRSCGACSLKFRADGRPPVEDVLR